jgi:AcrR family transcriptional regulator
VGTDARVVRSRTKLQNALLDLVREKRLEDITVAEITAQADVGYATFFRHYPDKTALWHDVSDAMTTKYLEQIGPLVDDPDSTQIARQLCRFVEANWDALRAITTQGAEGAIRQDLVTRAAALTESRSSAEMEGLPRDLAILHATSATLGLLVWWMDHPDEVTFDQMVEIVDRLIIAPVRGGRAATE